jgi:putative hydrolase of the HAD superfamily
MYKNFFDGYEAVIFDLDGTVVYDEPVWQEALYNIFSKEIISDKPVYGERGQNLRAKIFYILNSNSFRSNISEESYYQLVKNEFFKNIDQVLVTSGFIEFANFLKSKNIKLVLVTNSDLQVTEGIIEKLKIKKYFDMILTADDVDLPKPAPDIYNLAITKLGISKNKILVFEDSVNGARAAELADLNTIVVLPNGFMPTDYSSKNKIFIEDFNVINEDLDTDGDSYLNNFINK